jgi:predicted alpha/beta superfamily hydrolase
MRALTNLTFLTIIFLISCSPKDNKKKNDEFKFRFTQYSESVKDTFYIDVQVPNHYFEKPDNKYPTLIFVDGNFFFPMMAPIISQYEFTGLLHPAIVVAVGYKSFPMMDSLRIRDYMFPKALPSDEIKADGGGQKFYDFITKELLPKIDKEYRTEPTNRSLLGHSFGGYFVLYGLMNQLQNKTHDFKSFVSASPTLWYNNFYLNQLPDLLDKSEGPLGIFVSVGGREDSTWSVKPVKDLTTEIQKRNIKGLDFKSRIYNHLEHMDVAVLSFTKGLQELEATKNKTK